MYRNRHRARGLAIAASLVISAAVLIPVAAVAAPSSKGQDPNVTPTTVDRGTTAAFAVSITNTSTSGNITAQGIRVYIPVGLDTGDIQLPIVKPTAGTLTNPATTLAAPTPYIEILSANVTRNQTYTFTINARIPCNESVSQYSWVTDVRQSNDFSGTGNELPGKDVPVTTVSAGGCSLAFTAQPKNATPGAIITNSAFNTSGDPVKVAVKSGGAAPVTVTWFTGSVALTTTPAIAIGGTTSQALASGEATFNNLTIAAAGTYTLNASTTGVTDAPSDSFTIGYGTTTTCTLGDGTICTTGTIPGQTSGTSGVVTVNDSDGLTANLTAAFVTSDIDCAGYVEFGDRLFFDVTNVTAGSVSGLFKTVTLTKPTPDGRPNTAGNEWRYQVCFQSRDTFQALPTYSDAQTNYDNLLEALSSDDFTDPAELVPEEDRVLGDLSQPEYRGLLASCSLAGVSAPCLTSVTLSGGSVTFVASVPAGDPQMK